MIKTKQNWNAYGSKSSLDKKGIDGGKPWEWRDKPKIDENIENFSQYDESFVNKRSKK